MGSPTKVKAPGNDLASMLSGIIEGSLNPQSNVNFQIPGGGSLGSFLQSRLQLPGYQGQVAAAPNFAETGTLGALTRLFGQNAGASQGSDVLSLLSGLAGGSTTNGNPAASTTFQLPGTSTLSSASAGALQPQATLAQLASTQPDFFSNLASSLTSQTGANPAIAGLTGFGSGSNLLDTAANALRGQANIGLQQGLGNLREQFSGLGLRNSTNLANADANLIAQNAANTGAQLATLYPTLTGQQISALSSAGGLANQQQGQAGQLAASAAGLGVQNQGNQANILSQILGSQTGAGSTLAQLAAQIYGNQQSNATSAALALPGATSTLGMLPFNQGAALFGLGSQQQANTQTGLNNLYQAYLNQQGLINAIPQLITGVPAPTVAGGSPLQQGVGLGLSALAGYTGLKNSKG